jgi:hypothetical protein
MYIPKPGEWIIGMDPFKKVKWYHKVQKFFGKKIKTGSIVIFRRKEDGTIETVKQRDLYL